MGPKTPLIDPSPLPMFLAQIASGKHLKRQKHIKERKQCRIGPGGVIVCFYLAPMRVLGSQKTPLYNKQEHTFYLNEN